MPMYLEPVWDCYLNFFFKILVASTYFQIPLIHDDYKRVIKSQFILNVDGVAFSFEAILI